MGIWFLALQHYPLASIISLETLQYVLATFGYPAVALFILIESAGIPFPGETMLLLASFYAAIDQRLQIPIVIACAAAGAIIGDNLGYYVGRVGGRRFVQRFGRYFFVKPHHLSYAERFFEKHGGKTVFFGRFTAILRAWAAFLAGVHQMHWRTFLIYNAAGGILWAIIYGLLGYLAGRVFHDNFAQVEQIAGTMGWIGAAIFVLVLATAIVLIRRRQRIRAKNVAAEQDQAQETNVPAERHTH
ncbi:DedA family protein [Ktedonosporobacter rubrisoli]|uniref:DedA family protein n=1 Tax=Ktedonosporobacter rubrisoli TaxID=2509675 RepID=A0A4P6JT72_KTERU|nr:DedA family protein [Ktedonosporobacter rubrisoli]QBD78452.1 DedA family protein [Ktedonosporobacter rubrisoli]